MEIYIVIGGVAYEGHEPCTIRWFTSKEKAHEYFDELAKQYDYVDITTSKEGEPVIVNADA